MLHTPDLYLGTFLILAGFALSLLNLRRIVRRNGEFSAVLLSENILLTCIGIAFISRAISEVTMENMAMETMEARSVEIMENDTPRKCSFQSVFLSYGPVIVSLVNSFLSLIIDNYMHYKMIKDVQKNDEQNNVRDISQEQTILRRIEVKKCYNILQNNFSFIAIVVQWIVPLLTVLAMYPMEVKEKLMPFSELTGKTHSCMAMFNVKNETCTLEDTYTNFTLEFRKYINSPTKYIQVYDDNQFKQNNSRIDSVVRNVYKIVANLKNNSFLDMNVSSPHLYRKSKTSQNCLNMCFLDNKSLLLYMFILAVVSYFVPITISTIILTKIHIMDVQKKHLKTYVSRELLYNILFWTPVMFDTFLSLILCSYSIDGVRTSLFNVVANVYQAVKNFMNTKYFKDNTIVPV